MSKVVFKRLIHGLIHAVIDTLNVPAAIVLKEQ